MKQTQKATDVFSIGQPYYFQMVGNVHLIGIVRARFEGFVELESASFLLDHQLSRAIVDGQLHTVQPVGSTIISLGMIAMAFRWMHSIPKLPWSARR